MALSDSDKTRLNLLTDFLADIAPATSGTDALDNVVLAVKHAIGAARRRRCPEAQRDQRVHQHAPSRVVAPLIFAELMTALSVPLGEIERAQDARRKGWLTHRSNCRMIMDQPSQYSEVAVHGLAGPSDSLLSLEHAKMPHYQIKIVSTSDHFTVGPARWEKSPGNVTSVRMGAPGSVDVKADYVVMHKSQARNTAEVVVDLQLFVEDGITHANFEVHKGAVGDLEVRSHLDAVKHSGKHTGAGEKVTLRLS